MGAVSANVTFAPEAGTPPFNTEAVRETVAGGTKALPEAARLTLIEAGAMTVALAVAEVLKELLVALRFTAYVPAGVPIGAAFAIATVMDCPGASVTEAVEREVDHPEGWLELRLMVVGEHAEESLLVRDAE